MRLLERNLARETLSFLSFLLSERIERPYRRTAEQRDRSAISIGTSRAHKPYAIVAS